MKIAIDFEGVDGVSGSVCPTWWTGDMMALVKRLEAPIQRDRDWKEWTGWEANREAPPARAIKMKWVEVVDLSGPVVWADGIAHGIRARNKVIASYGKRG